MLKTEEDSPDCSCFQVFIGVVPVLIFMLLVHVIIIYLHVFCPPPSACSHSHCELVFCSPPPPFIYFFAHVLKCCSTSAALRGWRNPLMRTSPAHHTKPESHTWCMLNSFNSFASGTPLTTACFLRLHAFRLAACIAKCIFQMAPRDLLEFALECE